MRGPPTKYQQTMSVILSRLQSSCRVACVDRIYAQFDSKVHWLHHHLQLAPSPRILVYLACRRRSPTTMALTRATQEKSSSHPIPDTAKPEVFVSPPEVVITPFRPWPRPYLFEDGLRKVAPYHFTYNTCCKARWRGRELIDIFATEFRDRPQTYYVNKLLSLSNISLG